MDGYYQFLLTIHQLDVSIAKNKGYIFSSYTNDYILYDRVEEVKDAIGAKSLYNWQLALFVYDRYRRLGGSRMAEIEDYYKYDKYEVIRQGVLAFWTSIDNRKTTIQLKALIRISPDCVDDLRLCLMMGRPFREYMRNRDSISYQMLENFSEVRVTDQYNRERTHEARMLELIRRKFPPYSEKEILSILKY